ncbi:DUF4320 family protein [Caproiciproducens faecalis]|uniref:DUF4320 family protein n=1 Tax=Caproiciproducens faecalis TaxID=2820301 RepID=A0ABS7DPD4_9FIRM|nr:DUF4320 family protein [Caproiciproducens faecalis]MBW7573174.1 DUF4320 family protein [Caproiciproducens faecalis]
MRYIKSRRGDTIISLPILVMAIAFCVAFFLKVSPAFLVKQKLDTYAGELCRVAEISGRVGTETAEKEEKLNQSIGISPNVEWSKTGTIQLNDTITVTCTTTYNLGLFGNVGSFPVTLQGKASGQSEVYWK